MGRRNGADMRGWLRSRSAHAALSWRARGSGSSTLIGFVSCGVILDLQARGGDYHHRPSLLQHSRPAPPGGGDAAGRWSFLVVSIGASEFVEKLGGAGEDHLARGLAGPIHKRTGEEGPTSPGVANEERVAALLARAAVVCPASRPGFGDASATRAWLVAVVSEC
jgi:hypothetical protein